MIARRLVCPEKLGSNPGQGSKGINFSGWHGLDMSVTVTKRLTLNSNKQTTCNDKDQVKYREFCHTNCAAPFGNIG